MLWRKPVANRSFKKSLPASSGNDLIRERTIAGLQATRARGRRGGRKPAMSDSGIRKAAAMLSDPNITKTEVAAHFGVTRTTLNSSLARIAKIPVTMSDTK